MWRGYRENERRKTKKIKLREAKQEAKDWHRSRRYSREKGRRIKNRNGEPVRAELVEHGF